MGQVARRGDRGRGRLSGDPAQSLRRTTAPEAAVVLADELETDLAPEVGEVAEAPVGLDLEVDAPGGMVLGEQEPLETLLDVPLQGVVAEPEIGRVVLILLADAVHA